MGDRLVNFSTILLFGREMDDITYTQAAGPNAGSGGDKPATKRPDQADANNFVDSQLAANGARFARIFGFSFEGQYYDLARPQIFLVHGDGAPAEVVDAVKDRLRGSVDQGGTATRNIKFADDLRAWAYEKSDFSVRLDPDIGPLEQ
ncbi:MAG: hypothetical protein AAGF56_15530, partial [Pseudomonadota bacterium]